MKLGWYPLGERMDCRVRPAAGRSVMPSRTKAFFVDRLNQLPLWLSRPAGALVRRLWRGFRDA